MGKKLTVYLIDGTDSGPRLIEIGNWSGKAMHSPRNALVKLMDRQEFGKPGIYVLKSDPIEDLYSERIYIGEAENIGNRLRQHLRNSDRDFKECIFFVSKDELLTKSHIKYIESRLIALAREAMNAEIENGNTPTESSLSEADVSDMEQFIDQIKLILPVAGYHFLSSSIKLVRSGKDQTEELPAGKLFILKNNKYDAKMIETSDGFLVLRGSEANKETAISLSEGWKKIRKKLIKQRTWADDGEKWQFAEHYLFSSPSAASSVVLGRQSPGPLEWIDQEGKTYKEHQQQLIGMDLSSETST